MALVFIGMPVFNGEKFIAQALESLCRQSCLDWTLLIADNDSTDRTAQICKSFFEKDSRIHYVRHSGNMGAAFNFRFLLDSAQEKYFMWAASDDLWEPEFLEAAVSNLNRNPDAGLAFCNIVSIDSFGQVIREIPSFGLFDRGDRYTSVANYVLAPEFLGKANLIYGVYRFALMKDYMVHWMASQSATDPGSDMSFILGVLCRARIVIDERTLFKKRLERGTDLPGNPAPIATGLPYVSVWPKKDQDLYFNDMQFASAGTPYAGLVDDLVNYRASLNQNILEVQAKTKTEAYTNMDSNFLLVPLKNKMLRKIKSKLKQKKKALDVAYRNRVRKREEGQFERKALRFYSQFISRNSLCFDVGANIGNRTKLFLEFGARVVAVEPQGRCAEVLTRTFGGNKDFFLVQKGLGAAEGIADLNISNADTISSISTDWINSVKQSGRFKNYSWDKKQQIMLTTLDTLIGQFGNPGFIKIDVEGYEYEVLKGLTQATGVISFEFTPEYLDATLMSLKHLQSIGEIQANYSLGESMELSLDHWISVDELVDRLKSYKDSNSVFGDVYVRFVSQTN